MVFIVIPFIVYFVYLANWSELEKGFYKYSVFSLFMYIAGDIIYILIPTTTTPKNFIDGNYSNFIYRHYFLLSYKRTIGIRA